MDKNFHSTGTPDNRKLYYESPPEHTIAQTSQVLSKLYSACAKAYVNFCIQQQYNQHFSSGTNRKKRRRMVATVQATSKPPVQESKRANAPSTNEDCRDTINTSQE